MEEQTLRVPARSVFAAILLDAMNSSRDRPEGPTVVDLSNKILELKNNAHLDVSNIPIRADRDGWISDDFSSFINRFVLFGIAKNNPVCLTDRGRKLCEEILLEDSTKYPTPIDTLIRAIGLKWRPTREKIASLA
jgi:hypothetical protein